MAENSHIQWTDNTFNPWIGCFKVSPGCKFCYAETFMTRKGKWANTWGPPGTTERIKTSAANWAKPLQWQRQAAKDNKRIKVFCASLADIFEDNPQLYDWRIQLFSLISETPNLDWQILTKRPDVASEFFKKRPHLLMPNIWLGTSVENQEQADKRIPELLSVPASVRFLSIEPLLGGIDLNHLFWYDGIGFRLDNSIDWVIIGGESGPDARPFYLGWARDLIQQCQAAKVPVFMKQLGSNQAEYDYNPAHWRLMQFFGRFTDDKKGGDINEWPTELQVREFPQC